MGQINPTHLGKLISQKRKCCAVRWFIVEQREGKIEIANGQWLRPTNHEVVFNFGSNIKDASHDVKQVPEMGDDKDHNVRNGGTL